ncbi:hypothetical protein GF407_05715 [candidate division KSB1 bacterium]|nr:hypothetical protein [candidate division KSB1 bacterium]
MSAKHFLIISVCALIAASLQMIGLIRYAGRLPNDWIGILLYVVTIIAFLLAALYYFGKWRRESPD